MKPLDQQHHNDSCLQLENLKSAYSAIVPGEHDFDVLIRNAIHDLGIANMDGVPLCGVSVQTKLAAMRRLMADL